MGCSWGEVSLFDNIFLRYWHIFTKFMYALSLKIEAILKGCCYFESKKWFQMKEVKYFLCVLVVTVSFSLSFLVFTVHVFAWFMLSTFCTGESKTVSMILIVIWACYSLARVNLSLPGFPHFSLLAPQSKSLTLFSPILIF